MTFIVCVKEIQKDYFLRNELIDNIYLQIQNNYVLIGKIISVTFSAALRSGIKNKDK